MLEIEQYQLHLELEHVDSIFHSLQDLGGITSDATPLKSTHGFTEQDYRKKDISLESITMYYKGTYVSSQTERSIVGPGVIHLYRGILNETDTIYPRTSIKRPASSDVLAILAVPSYMTSTDLLGFFGESLQKISHIRLLRTDDLRRYIVLLKFRVALDATLFQERFNGAVFNPMEPETVHCVSIASISFCGQMRSAKEFPTLTAQAQEGTRTMHRMTYKALPPIMSLVELPTCVVCLERMDASSTGLLTIACEHTFHCACISKWVDSQATCPICRFSVAKDVLKKSDKRCFAAKCSSNKNLWMCLICGAINCGRYESQHAIRHFEQSKHAFAMDLESGRIWDYSSDAYVHRLLEDKIGASSLMTKSGSKYEDSSGTEFEELLATQLESQRLYYEEQVSTAVSKASKAIKEVQTAEQIANDLKVQLNETELMLSAERASISRMRIFQDRTEDKSKIISELARRTQKQFVEEKSINESLMRKIAYFEESLSESLSLRSKMQTEMDELKEQVRDLMVHFASAQTISAMDEEDMQGAKIELAESHTNGCADTKLKSSKKTSKRRSKQN